MNYCMITLPYEIFPSEMIERSGLNVPRGSTLHHDIV